MTRRDAVARLTSIVTVAVLMLSSCQSKTVEEVDVGPVWQESVREAEKFWDASFSRCGDSYYGVYTPRGRPSAPSENLLQLREPKVYTVHDYRNPPTSSEKLNGVEWKGNTTLIGSAHRRFQNGRWGSWFAGAPNEFAKDLSTSVNRVKGRWVFGINEESPARFTKIDCSQVPQ